MIGKVFIEKMCPIYHIYETVLQDIKKILRVCSFNCKKLLNFPYHTTKFQNCHHTSSGTQAFFETPPNRLSRVFSGPEIFEALTKN